MVVLIADDSEFIRNNLSKLLKTSETIEEVYVAKTVKESIELMNAVQPDVLVLDIKFPDGMGFEVLDAAKSKKEKPPVVFIFTNYPFDHYKSRSYNGGADYFFDKSADYDKIFDAIEKLNPLK